MIEELPTPSGHRSRRRAVVAVVAAVSALAALAPGAAAVDTERSGAGSSARQSGRSTTATTIPMSSERRAAESSVGDLRRDREAVRAELAVAAAARDQQFDRWAISQLASEKADGERVRMDVLAEQARRDVIRAELRVRKYAREAFMRPPTVDTLAVLSIGNPDEMSRAHEIVSITAEDQRRVVDDLNVAKEAADLRNEDAAAAADAAREQADDAREQLQQLDAAFRRQEQLAAEVEQRLGSAMAEVEALRAVDARAAAELEAEERKLAEEARATVADAPADRAAADTEPSAPSTTTTQPPAPTTPSPSRPPSRPAPTPAPAPPTTTPPTTTTTARPKPPPVPSDIVGWNSVTKVGGIWVHQSIAGRVRSLLNAASNAGLSLGGGGYRDPKEQIRFRAGPLRPHLLRHLPEARVAVPAADRAPGSVHARTGSGHRLHLRSGSLITSRSNPAFQWLAANAASYGFYNLPSEPWHWSINGT